MNILLVRSGDETIGGVAYVVGNLAKRLRDSSHQVFFFNLGKGLLLESKTTKTGFPGFELNLQMPFGDRNPVISLLLFCLRFPFGLFQLAWFIKRHRIQVVNVHYPAESFVYLGICRHLLPIKLITSVHGADLFPGGIRRAEYPKSIKWLLRASDLIVAPSNAYRQDVARVFPELTGKIVFIHNGVDLSEVELVPGTSTSPNGTPYVLCVAMHNEKKGIDVLLRAFAQLQDAHPNLRLVLAGDGPLRVQLEALAASLGLTGKVEFCGRQTRSQVGELLRNCEVFVLPSRSEPFGIVLIEAMACGKPVVATTAGGIPEIVQNEVNGILVEPDNSKALAQAIDRVLEDEILQMRLATKGLKTAREQFNFAHTAASYEAVLSRLKKNSAESSEFRSREL